MKHTKIFLALLLFVVLLGTAGCGGAATPPEGETPAENPTDTTSTQTAEAVKTNEEIIRAIEEARDFAFNWFYACTYVNQDDIIFDTYQDMPKWTYRKVDYPGVTTLEDVRQLAGQHYTADVVNQLIGNLGWAEMTTPKTGLYVSDPNGLGGGMFIDAQVSIRQEDDTCYTITVRPYCEGELLQDPYDVHYRLINGSWAFDTSLLLFADSITVV